MERKYFEYYLIGIKTKKGETSMILTQNSRKITSENAMLIYDSKTGSNLVLHDDAGEIIKMFEEGKSVYDIQQEYDVEGLNEFIDALVERRLLIEAGQVNKPFETFFNPEMLSVGGLVRHLRLNVTEKCNLDCSYCFERVSNVYAKKRNMSWEIAKESLDKFIALNIKNQSSEISIRFFGGEPLINWDLVVRCLDYNQTLIPDSIKINYIMNTNGTLLTDEIAKKLAQHGVAISLSLDGDEESHNKTRCYLDGRGSFAEVDKRIKHLTENKCQFNLSVVCSNENFPYLRNLIDYIDRKQTELDYGIPVNFNNIQICEKDTLDTNTVEDKVAYLVDVLEYAREKGIYAFGGLTHFVFQKFINGYVGKYCGGTGSELSVDPDGNVFPCSGLDIQLGTIHDLNAIFKSELYQGIANRGAGYIKQCEGCEIEGFCAGGCLADVISASGSMDGDYDGCELQKHTFHELVKSYILISEQSEENIDSVV